MVAPRKATTSPVNNRLRTVVIDAGHGGKDPGGMGANSQEKHIALSVASLLSERIRGTFPEIKVIMTRSDDTFIPLFERAAIANRHKADLFISIHANIMPGSKATAGTETFVMGQHVASYNLDVAKRENASILLEADYETNYDYDPSSDEGHILMAMYQNAFLEQSILFAELVEQQFAQYAGRKSRGVKQAGFVVLKATAMPSVLVETGFMSNPGEERYLLSESGQVELAGAIFEAFRAYRQLMDAENNPSLATKEVIPAAIPTSPKPILREVPPVNPATISVSNTSSYRTQRRTRKGGSANIPTTPAAAQRMMVGNPALLPVKENNQQGATEKQPAILAREVQPMGSAPLELPVTYQKKSIPAFPAETIEPTAAPTVATDQLIFAVQLAAVQRELSMSEPNWREMNRPLLVLEEENLFKYQVRGLADAQAAVIAKKELLASGFPEAFIVAYRNGKRLSTEQTRTLLGN
jgi:N-acetylmuramoyl-L-alanine amidase